MKIAVTGSRGLVGWHAAARMHAANCAARFSGVSPPYELVQLDREDFTDPPRLADRLRGVAAVLHFAGINRGEDAVVEATNPGIARRLVAACGAAGVTPHIVYANSTHSAFDTPYGRSKRNAGEILKGLGGRYTDLVLPHIFGECARPNYNNVTATLIDRLWKNEALDVNPEGRVELLHAGEAAMIAIRAAVQGHVGTIRPPGRPMTVPALSEKLEGFHALYSANIFPDLSDAFDLAAKGGNASQSFMSSTVPGAVRGDHFHLGKVERFLVVKGKAVIRIRKVLTDELHEFNVSGDAPAAIDMPPLHTHNIENKGRGELLTLFWTHDIFDPSAPDTYADPV